MRAAAGDGMSAAGPGSGERGARAGASPLAGEGGGAAPAGEGTVLLFFPSPGSLREPPSPTRGEGEEGAFAAVSIWAITASTGTVAPSFARIVSTPAAWAASSCVALSVP